MSQRENIRTKMAEVLGTDAARVSDTERLVDLVNSSFLIVEMVIELQEEFDVRFHQADMSDITTVGQLLDLVESRVASSSDG